MGTTAIAIATVSAFAFQASDQACPAPTVCGTVVDANGAPIEAAEVTIERNGAPIVVATDNAGRFRAENAADPTGITVIADERDAVTIAYDAFRVTGARIVVDDPPALAEADILVTARKASLPFSRQVIEKIDLLTDPIANADALLAVAGLPSATNLDNSADVQLRGSAAGLSRTYYNDVPLYEVVRGSSVDQVTRVSSIFNASILRNIETYPTLSPAYLPNTAAGAVRIVPAVDGSVPSSVFLGLPGTTASAAFALPNGSVQAYASAIDLSGTLALNPKLKATTDSFTSAAIGLSAVARTSGGTEVTSLSVIDVERGAYPLRLLNLSGVSTNRRLRSYNLVGVEAAVGDERLKLDLSATGTSNDLEYLGQKVSANNLYLYANADLAGNFLGGLIEYRTGVSGEHFRLAGAGAFTADDAQARRRLEKLTYGSAHAFVTLQPVAFLTLAVGGRQYTSGDRSPGATYSAAATLSSEDRRHKLIVGGGTFGAIIPPELISTTPLMRAQSRQVSIDYEFAGGPVDLKVGGYLKTDRVNESLTRIEGFDGSIVVRPTSWLRLSASFARSRQRSAGFRADRDLGHFVRIQSRLSLSATAAFNATFTTKSGAPYTRVLRGGADGAGGFFPVFDDTINGARLRRFETLDVNIFERLQLTPKFAPIVFVGVTNLLDRRNESRPVYNADFSHEERSYFERRALSFGIVQSF
ncbi:carboxypeptidase-like regulatory domain-containing protein [Sphingomonas qomolangmaensis]|uniref:Carboxypeptidase-like regulatory domain-containing protein n=1 Tax=Sphingomonas qomolangmaensis TaxID=2918765 RepID=A0ABY5L6U0_9SPHN|nr:carboxypeptidase-like regulatory domain-containing protein [Sphingomonas qomolangmaensis]UUL82497.1 carboxypeptidase-like regulatory domain-containing protein [Sphingomonas qomolangmaensis]